LFETFYKKFGSLSYARMSFQESSTSDEGFVMRNCGHGVRLTLYAAQLNFHLKVAEMIWNLYQARLKVN